MRQGSAPMTAAGATSRPASAQPAEPEADDRRHDASSSAARPSTAASPRRGWRPAPRAARSRSADRPPAPAADWLTLTHAISSTTPTDANSSSSAGRDVPTTASCAGSRERPSGPPDGPGARRLAAISSRMTSRSAFAAATVTPGLKPADAEHHRPGGGEAVGRRKLRAGGMNRRRTDEIAVARHRAASNGGASTPITVSGAPLTVIVAPIAAGSPLNRRRQKCVA